MGKIFQSAALMSLLSSVPVIIGMRSVKPIMTSWGSNKDLYTSVDDYYRIFSCCVPLRNLYTLSENFSIAEGHVGNTTWISSISLLSCGLISLFVRGPDAFKFSNVFEGLAVASFIEAVASICGYLAIFRSQKDFEKYDIFDSSIDWDVSLKILKKSSPIFLKKIASAITPLVYTYFIIPDKPDSLAALSLISQILLPLDIITNSIGKSLNISIRRSMDQEINVRALECGKIGMIQNQAIAAAFIFCTYWYSELIASYIVDIESIKNRNMMENYRDILILQLLNQLIYALENTSSWSLRGIGQLNKAAYSEIFTSCIIALPLSYYLVKSCDYGVQGAVMGDN